MGYRDDGSINSNNNPVWDNRYQIRDYALYKGIVNKVIYSDSEDNDLIDEEFSEVMYDLIIIGGDRDGQLVSNARMIRPFGGRFSFWEYTLQEIKTVSNQEISSELNLTDTLETAKGDVVYFQFLNGDPMMPIILGCAKHVSNKQEEAASGDGQVFRTNVNGIKSEIDKDGVFTWIKTNGAFASLGQNPDDPLKPYLEEWAPDALDPDGAEAIKVTVTNEYLFELEMSKGLKVSLDGKADSASFISGGGANILLDGTADAVKAVTAGGASVTLDGEADSFSFVSAGGASITVDGSGDTINHKLSNGTEIAIGASEIAIALASGVSIAITDSNIEIKDATGGALKIENGLVALGGPGGELLQILEDFLLSMSTATYAGQGAPGSNVADIAQAQAKIAAIKGSL